MRILRPSLSIPGSLLGMAFSLSLPPTACGQAALATPQTVHVAVRVFDLNNEPVRTLHSTNFLLTSGSGTPVPATLESPDTHLLLILSPGQGDLTAAGVHALAQQLEPLWKAGWHISIHDAQGRETPYLADKAALHTAVLTNALTGHASVPDALGTLAEFPGLRVVFVQTGPSFQVDPSTIRLAMRYHAMLYRIGASRSNRYFPVVCGETSSFSHPAQVSIATAGSFFQPTGCTSGSAPTPYLHQVTSFRSAAHDALQDAAAFYDLRTVVPSDTPTLTLAVSPSPYSPATFRITAQPWADEHQPLPTITIRSSFH